MNQFNKHIKRLLQKWEDSPLFSLSSSQERIFFFGRIDYSFLIFTILISGGLAAGIVGGRLWGNQSLDAVQEKNMLLSFIVMEITCLSIYILARGLAYGWSFSIKQGEMHLLNPSWQYAVWLGGAICALIFEMGCSRLVDFHGPTEIYKMAIFVSLLFLIYCIILYPRIPLYPISIVSEGTILRRVGHLVFIAFYDIQRNFYVLNLEALTSRGASEVFQYLADELQVSDKEEAKAVQDFFLKRSPSFSYIPSVAYMKKTRLD